MQTASAISKKIDYSGLFPNLEQYSAFDAGVMESLRLDGQAKKSATIVIIDRGYGLPDNNVVIVKSHLNLTGSNPLCGPNHPIGERFPVLADVYVAPAQCELLAVVAAGLKPGCNPSMQEMETIRKVGGDCWCYNLIPTAIVAAHAGLQVVALLVPFKDAQSTDDIRARVSQQLAGLELE